MGALSLVGIQIMAQLMELKKTDIPGNQIKSVINKLKTAKGTPILKELTLSKGIAHTLSELIKETIDETISSLEKS